MSTTITIMTLLAILKCFRKFQAVRSSLRNYVMMVVGGKNVQKNTTTQCNNYLIVPVFQIFILARQAIWKLNVTLVTIWWDVTATHVTITPAVRQSGLIGRQIMVSRCPLIDNLPTGDGHLIGRPAQPPVPYSLPVWSTRIHNNTGTWTLQSTGIHWNPLVLAHCLWT